MDGGAKGLCKFNWLTIKLELESKSGQNGATMDYKVEFVHDLFES